MDDAIERRRRARAAWSVEKTTPELANDAFVDATPMERVAMVWPMTVEAWRLAGREIPGYDREHTPVELIRRKR